MSAPSRYGSTSVSAPGQKQSISRSATVPMCTSFAAWRASATWTISGLNDGRPFAS